MRLSSLVRLPETPRAGLELSLVARSSSSRATACGLQPPVQLADPVPRLEVREPLAGFELPILLLLHTDAPRDLARGRRRALNPLDAIDETDRPTVNYLRAGQHRALDLTGARAVLEAFEGHEWEGAVAIALGGGLRRGEILGLTLGAISESTDGRIELEIRQVVSVSGGGARLEADVAKSAGSLRTVTLPLWASEKVRHQILTVKQARLRWGPRWVDHDLLFPRMGGIGGAGRDALGSATHPTTLTRAFKERLAEVGIEGVRFHDLRHTHITLGATDAAVPVPVMQRRAGHVRLETTAGYLDPSRAADGAVAVAFDRLFGA